EPPDFDRDTALERIGDGVWRGRVQPHWYVVAGANGGLPAAQATRAMMLAVADPLRLPQSLTLHYLEAPTEGELDYRVSIERAGGVATAVSIRATRDERVIALGLGWLGRWREDGPEWTEAAMPRVAPPADAARLAPREGGPAMLVNYDLRLALGARPMSGAERSEIAAWIRTARPRRLDHPALAAYSDALYPAVWPRLTSVAFMPTLDLTLHWRAPMPDGDHPWILGRFWSERTGGGVFEENGELWSEDGQLLLQSRQLAVLRVPKAGSEAGRG
ncbi:MAG: thioesterase family protein, partial [Solirubrobacterales bacterium]|nr:thioesterase family protein [Solirubrobacterales bacterium]